MNKNLEKPVVNHYLYYIYIYLIFSHTCFFRFWWRFGVAIGYTIVAKTPRLPCPRNTTQWPPGPPQQDDTPVAPAEPPSSGPNKDNSLCCDVLSRRLPAAREVVTSKETYIIYNRRKFRSLTSDNMQSWKSRVEMSSQQKEDQHACRVTRKKYMCEKC